MIIDFHTHIGRSHDGAYQSISDTLKTMKQFGIERSFVFPIDEPNSGPSYQKLNRKIAGIIKRHKNIFGCARLNPNELKASYYEIEQAVKHGFRAIKFHPRSDQFCAKDAKPLFQIIAQNKLIVILHTDHYSNCYPQDWFPIFVKYPKTYFILTHAGKDVFGQAVYAAKNFSNVYLDTSTISYYRTGVILRQAGIKKIVFASDVPYSHVELEIKKFELLLPSQKRKFVFLENARKILNL